MPGKNKRYCCKWPGCNKCVFGKARIMKHEEKCQFAQDSELIRELRRQIKSLEENLEKMKAALRVVI